MTMMTTDRKSAAQRGYDSRWRKSRIAYLFKHPLCRMCERAGRVTAAVVVDHIKPHRGDMKLFWDSSNWQPLCNPHHVAAKQAEEARGFSTEIGADGWPVDELHPANRRGR